MTGRIRAMMVLLAAVGGLTGCQAFERPHAEVRSVAVTERTAEGARVEVTVMVTNPNDVALPVRSADYAVQIDDVGRFSFNDEPPVTLPPRGTQAITLPAAFVAGDAPIVGRQMRVSGLFRYQPPGEIRELMRDYHLPLPTVPFDATAELDSFVDE